MYKYLLTFLLFFFSGCFSNSNITKDVQKIENEHSTKKIYKDISKDAIFEAAKKVFILTGANEFRIDSYRDSLIVSKTKLSAYPFYSSVAEDRWEISIEEKDNSSYLKILGKRINNFDDKNIEYLNKKLNNLIIDRIEFFLGLKKNWSLCVFSLGFDDALCDIVDLKVYSLPSKKDVLTNILISQRKPSKSVIDSQDILQEDISFSLDDQGDDILSQEDDIEVGSETREFDAEILELDRKVNKNLNKTLNKIENSVENKDENNEKDNK